MAAIESIRGAQQVLEDKLLDLVTIIKIVDEVAGDAPPDWVSLFLAKILDIDKAAHDFMDEVHTKAIPVLADMQSLAK